MSYSTQITDAGCATLAAAIESGTLPALKEVDLGGIPASAAAKAAVQEALDKLRATMPDSESEEEGEEEDEEDGEEDEEDEEDEEEEGERRRVRETEHMLGAILMGSFSRCTVASFNLGPAVLVRQWYLRRSGRPQRVESRG